MDGGGGLGPLTWTLISRVDRGHERGGPFTHGSYFYPQLLSFLLSFSVIDEALNKAINEWNT